MTDQSTFSWDLYYQYRKKIKKQFPLFWKLRVIKKPLEILKKEVGQGDSILDIGAGNRVIGEKIKKALGINYKSMDVDRKQFHDYHSLDEIEESFDAILLFEVIEHLDLEEGVELIRKIYSLLAPGGKLFLTTPNLYHPHRYWDCHHKTPYRYDELGGLLSATGFIPRHVYRIYNDAFLRRLFRIYFAAPLHRYLNVDFAPSILMVAQRKN
ncbi:MAG: class I SAM-dependent methyltransferase [Proteobacteria bacterium]|nr:class I SAM-dependent methyltransferase [Pseudomonadota bacterium]